MSAVRVLKKSIFRYREDNNICSCIYAFSFSKYEAKKILNLRIFLDAQKLNLYRIKFLLYLFLNLKLNNEDKMRSFFLKINIIEFFVGKEKQKKTENLFLYLIKIKSSFFL